MTAGAALPLERLQMRGELARRRAKLIPDRSRPPRPLLPVGAPQRMAHPAGKSLEVRLRSCGRLMDGLLLGPPSFLHLVEAGPVRPKGLKALLARLLVPRTVTVPVGCGIKPHATEGL